jgi:U4/U6 small nuclear ribonucleoprotein PRP31
VTAALEEAEQQQPDQPQQQQQQQPTTAAGAPAPAPAPAALLEDDPTYRLLVDCNRLAADIDAEVAAVHAFLRDRYRARFPELESLVHSAVDYARVVERIGDAADIAAVELDDLLPAGEGLI